MKKLLCILAVICLLSACSKTEAIEQSSSLDETSSSSDVIFAPAEENSIPSPTAELVDKDYVTVYKFYEESKMYEPFKMPATSVTTVYDVIKLIEEKLVVTLPINKIELDKSYLTIDFSENILLNFNKSSINVMFNTIATTFFENVDISSIGFSVDGEFGAFGGETFTPERLKLIEETTENFAEIRAKIPYEGVISKKPERYFLNPTDEEKKMIDYLYALDDFTSDFDDINEYSGYKMLLMQIITATPYHAEISSGYAEERTVYGEELKPIFASVSNKLSMNEDMCWIKEHIEQTAKILLGEDFVIKHQDAHGFLYFESEGVYTPPHRGGNVNATPVIYKCEDLGDTVKLEVGYILYSSMGIYDVDADTGELISENDVEDYVKNNLKHREIVLKKTKDGGYNIISHKYL